MASMAIANCADSDGINVEVGEEAFKGFDKVDACVVGGSAGYSQEEEGQEEKGGCFHLF